ncbi:MAG: hypothetical protein BWX76_00307 [Candidatus Cloacimonetes bacterium ADurb.Bin089]|nr:MAG: hypothetical protein BWX76_00307 [Candidatus Cloacimonetes bacterium ADurb.Bin089]
MNNSFFSSTACFSFCFTDTFFSQVFNRLVNISVFFNQRFAAIHHSSSGSITQFFYLGCSNLCHFFSFLQAELMMPCKKTKLRSAIMFYTSVSANSGTSNSTFSSAASSASKSSVCSATVVAVVSASELSPSVAIPFPSITAFAIISEIK